MVSQKEKYLANAQKLIQKGQFDRAIKDYEQVIAADPKDLRHRQKLAELLVRCSRKEEAIKEYLTIANFYESNGFYLKAIAVYKQVQKLDNTNIDISHALAALNEKQGLVGNALTEYKTIFNYYEKAGLTDEAIKILAKMQAVDPENLEIQLKLADTYFYAGFKETAYEEYTKAALILKKSGNETAFEKLYSRIQTLFPAISDFDLHLLTEQLNKGIVADAVQVLRRMLISDDKNRKVLALLADAYKLSGDNKDRKSVCQTILEYFPDDITAKEWFLECIIEEGDFETCHNLISLYAPDMLKARLYAPLERSYLALQLHLPYDTRVLDGLKALYVATGDQAKLADVLVNIKILSQDISEQVVEFPQAGELILEINSPIERISTDTEIDFPWEEEIELSMPGDKTVTDFKVLDISDEIFLTETEEVIPWGQESGSISNVPDDLSIKPFLTSLEDQSAADISDDSSRLELAKTIYPGKQDPPVRADYPDHDLLLFNNGSGEDDLTTGVTKDSGKYCFDGIFSEFKRSLDLQVEQGDTETHYNLGIAYKEMGLYDDAINEFQIAAADPSRQADSLTLQGICYQAKGDITKAEHLFLSGIDLFELQPEKLLNIEYELALLYEASGRKDDALRYYRSVNDYSPGYRDSKRKISELNGFGSNPHFSNID